MVEIGFYVIWILLTLVLITLLFLKGQRWIKIKSWYEKWNLNYHQECFDKLYSSIDGFSLSRQAREHNDAMEYVYGEIEFISFIALLSTVPINKDTVFYDLGSGTGKAVLACTMVFNIKKSCGVELFENLYQCACSQKKQLAKLPEYRKKAEKINFINENYLDTELNDATLIFINSSASIGQT